MALPRENFPFWKTIAAFLGKDNPCRGSLWGCASSALSPGGTRACRQPALLAWPRAKGLTHANPKLECDSPWVGRVYPRKPAYCRHRLALLGRVPAASMSAGQGRASPPRCSLRAGFVPSEPTPSLSIPTHVARQGPASRHPWESWGKFTRLSSGAGVCSKLRRPLGPGKDDMMKH